MATCGAGESPCLSSQRWQPVAWPGELSLIILISSPHLIFRCCGFTLAGTLRAVREAWQELASWARSDPDQSGPMVRLSDVRGDGAGLGCQTLERDHSAHSAQ